MKNLAYTIKTRAGWSDYGCYAMGPQQRLPFNNAVLGTAKSHSPWDAQVGWLLSVARHSEKLGVSITILYNAGKKESTSNTFGLRCNLF